MERASSLTLKISRAGAPGGVIHVAIEHARVATRDRVGGEGGDNVERRVLDERIGGRGRCHFEFAVAVGVWSKKVASKGGKQR